MSTMSAFTLNLGGTDYNAVVINQNDGTTTKTESKDVGNVHFIHVVDRSGSMSGSLNRLLTNVEQTIDVMNDDDYFSLVWFSSPGEFKTLIKGAKKDKASISKLLQTIRYTLGTTCFSEPLAEVNTIVDDLAAVCPNFSVTFFTDGLPVVPWGVTEELNRVRKQVAKLAPRVLAINSIGYGNYYDQAFMTEMAAASQFGQFVHSRNIEDYSTIFRHNYERIAELVTESATLSAPGCQILYLTRNSSKLDTEGDLTLQALDKRKNQFVVFAPGDFSFTYNGETFTSKSVVGPKPTQATIENIQYALAYEFYYRGQRQRSLDILSHNLRDKALIDGQLVAFTFDEVAAYTEKLKDAVFKHGERNTNSAPDNYVPAGDAFSVFDLLTLLGQSDAYYVPGSDYKRIGLKTEDNFNLFQKDQDKTPMAPMDELVFNRDKLNVSIRFTIEGTVKLNPNQAQRVGLPEMVNARMFRNHTLVKDGAVNVPEARFFLDKTAYDAVKAENPDLIVQESTVTLPGKSGLYHDVTLDLTKIPVVNRTYLAQFPATQDVYELVRTQMELDAKAKVFNFYIKALDKSGNKGAAVSFTDEQLQVLKDHGLDRNLLYTGVDNKTESKDGADFYESRSLSFGIKGCASLPSVNDVLKKLADPKGKGLTVGQQIIKDQIDEVKKLVDLENPDEGSVTLLAQEARAVKGEVLNATAKLAALKVAKVMTGDWFDGVETSDKGEFFYKAPNDDIMVIKAEREKVYFSM